MIALLKDDTSRIAKTCVMELKWTSRTRNQRCIHTIKVAARKLISENTNQTWYTTLSAPGPFYTGVTVYLFLNHLECNDTSFDHLDGLDIIFDLHKLWDANPRVLQVIITMREAQQKLVRAKVLILNDFLVVFATLVLLRMDYVSCNRST